MYQKLSLINGLYGILFSISAIGVPLEVLNCMISKHINREIITTIVAVSDLIQGLQKYVNKTIQTT